MNSADTLSVFQGARATGRKLFALLIDPDSLSENELCLLLDEAQKAAVDLFLVGGSLLTRDALDDCLTQIKKGSTKPTVLFPGSIMQMSEKADALLFLSLVSGRNPDLLIGNQVIAAPYLRQMELETIATAYMLIESGALTTAQYMSGSLPLPRHKPEIAACTAMAAEMLGFKLIYLDGGSGAEHAVSEELIRAVRESVDIPIVVGGGIRSAEQAQASCAAGADVVVVGNAIEKNPTLIGEIARAVHDE